MRLTDRQSRKSYALHRMSLAIDRAMRSRSSFEKNTAMRWASAWGMVAGIRSPSARLRNSQMLNAE